MVVEPGDVLRSDSGEIAKAVADLLGALPEKVDYRVALMGGYDRTSRLSGRLLGLEPSQDSRSDDRVMSAKRDSVSRIEQSFAQRLSSLPLADQVATPTGLFDSLLQGMQGEAFVESRRLGFFRRNASLAVIFVSGRDLHTVKIDPVLEQLKRYSARGDRTFQRPFFVGAILLSSGPAPAPNGIEALAYLSANRLRSDIQKMAESLGLRLYRVAELRLRQEGLVPATLDLRVGGVRIRHAFDSLTGTIRLPLEHAGCPGTRVELRYCARK